MLQDHWLLIAQAALVGIIIVRGLASGHVRRRRESRQERLMAQVLAENRRRRFTPARPSTPSATESVAALEAGQPAGSQPSRPGSDSKFSPSS